MHGPRHAIASAAAPFGKLPDAAPPLPLPRANSEGAPVECMMAFVTGSSLNEEGEASGEPDRPAVLLPTIAIDMRTIILDERQAASIIMRGPYQVPTSLSKNHKQTLHIQLCRGQIILR